MVRGSTAMALRLGVSPMVIGLTIVAFGTSAPELAISIQSALAGKSAISLGNVLGSNIANIGLILGATALLSPFRIERETVRRQIPLIIICSLLLCALLADGQLGLYDGLLLSAGLLLFLYSSFALGRDVDQNSEQEAETVDAVQSKSMLANLAMVALGICLLVFGSTLLVDSAVEIAQFFGMSEAVIGLTIVAIGTSVPELATALVAVHRGQANLAIGNVIGSNLFNILGILGITAIIRPIFSAGFSPIDFIIMVGFALVLLPFAWTRLTLNRIEGLILLLSYLAYMAYLTLSV